MSSITNIDGSDLITNSRADINNNFSALNTDKEEVSNKSTDTTFAANSNTLYPSQAAVKAYVDAGGNVNATDTTKGIVEVATAAEVAAGTATGGTGASLVITPNNLPTVDIQTFTSDDTWTKPAGAKYVEVVCVGGGGNGGDGTKAASAHGGGGGGGGGYSKATFVASELSATESIDVGAAASASTFGTTKLVASGGSSGTAGSPGSGGAGGSGTIENGGSGGGGATTSANGTAGGSTKVAPSGGGGAGGSDAGGTSGAGGSITLLDTKTATAGVTGNSNGTAGTSATFSGASGSGASGGNNGDTAGSTDGGDGGAGGTYGAGGGGGGGADNAGAATVGSGGAGSPGIVIVTTYF